MGFDGERQGHINAVGDALAAARDDPCVDFVTKVLAHNGFKPSEERSRNSHVKIPNCPFRKIHFDPKPAELRREFATFLKTPEDVL